MKLHVVKNKPIEANQIDMHRSLLVTLVDVNSSLFGISNNRGVMDDISVISRSVKHYFKFSLPKL